jgi:hypothetical protein
VVVQPAPGTVLTSASVDLAGRGPSEGTVEVLLASAGGAETSLGAVPISESGSWQFSADLPGPGDFELRTRTLRPNRQVLATGSPVKVTVPQGITVSQACPCRLRISTQAPGATITLDERPLTGPQALFTDLKAGGYRYSVSAPGYKTFSKQASTPQNRNISVWLERQPR